MARRELEALGLSDLAPDDEWESPGRTVTEADVTAFAALSGDFNPLHVDHDFAARGPFRRPIAHGLLGMAILSGLASQSPRVKTVAFLGIREWNFREPIVFGDTVRVISRIASIEPRPSGRRGVVTWHRRLVNQRGEVVQEGTVITLVQGDRRPPRAAGETESVGPNGAEP
jgi:acyl dehydratase